MPLETDRLKIKDSPVTSAFQELLSTIWVQFTSKGREFLHHCHQQKGTGEGTEKEDTEFRHRISTPLLCFSKRCCRVNSPLFSIDINETSTVWGESPAAL